MSMESVQIRLTKEQIKNIDKLVNDGQYPNRSETVRDAVRKLLGSVENTE
ncbi:MAG: ribbon-helix-helix domain-containing protein [Candidatus Aenigmatarchaeota archaeon]